MRGSSTARGECDAEDDPRRRLPPEDQVPARYREVEREAYRCQRDVTPEVVASIGRPGAAGHVGDGLWHPLELNPDQVLTVDRPSGRDTRRATDAALRFLRDLGYRRGEDLDCLSALLRWCRGEYCHPDVAAAVDRYARLAGTRYHGAIIRAVDLPTTAATGRPDLSAFDARVVRNPETLLVEPVGDPQGLSVGRSYESPVPRSFAASGALSGNLYEVLRPGPSGASVRGFSALWAQDEVVLPARSILVPDRIEWHRSPGGDDFAVVYLKQLDAEHETI